MTTPHFEVYTTEPEARARAAILHFEQVRSFFLQASPFGKALDAPVRIVAFSSAGQYDPYRMNDASDAFYTRDEKRDYIVMQDLDPEHYHYAVHEYTHLVIAHSGLKIPLWMNEGWADLNSTLKPKGSKAMVGDMIPGRRDALTRGGWIPLAELDKVNQSSPMYSERNQASVFYAESWAFMHMLFLAPEYRKQFDAFVGATAAGKSIADVCQEVLGKPVTTVQADLEEYLRRDKLYGAVFPIKLTVPDEDPGVVPVDAFESGLVLANLLAVTHRPEKAKAAYEALGKQYPGRPEVDEGLGYLALGEGQRGNAMAAFTKALAEGSRDAAMCFRLAMLTRDETTDRTETIRALKRAIELQPENTEARMQLGIALLESKDYTGSLRELQQIRKVTEKDAAWYFSATAFDYARLGEYGEARKNADTAKKWAKTPQEISEADKILHFLDGKQGTAK